MLKIGITGGIGSGKSTVCKIIECLGFPVYYADERARYITENDPMVLRGIMDNFGPSVFTGGIPDRGMLAKLVFNDPAKLKVLNGIVHPAVRQDYTAWLQEQNATLVFSEIAILFESGRYKDFDKNILVTAPEELRVERVKKRSGISDQDIKNRMKNQWSDKEKGKLTDLVIVNDGIQALIPQVAAVIKSFPDSE